MNVAEKLGVDPTVYPVEEKMGDDILQRWIVELLRPLLERWLRDQGRIAFVGADQFIYWEQFNPRKSVAPDIYVLDDVKPDTYVSAWKVWESKTVPSFALEVVSSDRLKDYEDAPRRYGELGVAELVLFDPHADGPGRYRFQVLRRRGEDLVVVQRTNDDRIESESLGCFLRVVGEAMDQRLRIATGDHGSDVVPTDAEEVERLRAVIERLRGERAT